MYLTQQTTKQSTNEILGFFFDFGKEAVRQILPKLKSSQRSFKRSIEDFYPNTAIPFCLKVEGDITYEKELRYVSITVSFSENKEFMNTEKIMELIMENALLGGSEMPDFEPPAARASKGYKTLVDTVLRKNDGQTIQHSGHSRAIGSSEEALERASDGSQS